MRRSPMKPRRAHMPRGAGLSRSSVHKPEGKRPKRKRLGTKRPATGSRTELERRLASLLARRVKMRDGGRCRQAGCAEVRCAGPLDAGHIFPKGKYPGGRFLEPNLWSQCRRHNTAHIGRPKLMERRYVVEYGRAAYDALHALVLAQPRRQSIEWLQARIEECERAIAELELLAVA